MLTGTIKLLLLICLTLSLSCTRVDFTFPDTDEEIAKSLSFVRDFLIDHNNDVGSKFLWRADSVLFLNGVEVGILSQNNFRIHEEHKELISSKTELMVYIEQLIFLKSNRISSAYVSQFDGRVYFRYIPQNYYDYEIAFFVVHSNKGTEATDEYYLMDSRPPLYFYRNN